MAKKKLIFTGTWLDVDVLVLNNKMWTNEPKCNDVMTDKRPCHLPCPPPRIFSLFVFRNRLPIDCHHNIPSVVKFLQHNLLI